MAALRQGALAATVLTSMIVSVASGRGFGGFGNEFGQPAPYAANSTEWLQAVNASNTTGLFNIPGYDISKPWPGEPMDGWTLFVAAVDVTDPMAFDDQRFIGYSMNLKAPDSLIKTTASGYATVTADPSWDFCFWNWESPDFSNISYYNNPGNKSLASDGSCTGLLSDACIAALQKSAATNYYFSSKPSGPYNSRLVCPSLDTPPECGDGVGNTSLPLAASGGIPFQYLNGSVTMTDGWDKTNHFTAPNIINMWDSMAVNFWPVLTLFVHATNNSSTLDVEPGFATLRCIAPDGVGTGKVFTYSGGLTNETSENSTTGSSGGTTNSTTGGGTKSGAGMIYAPRTGAMFAIVLVLAALQACLV